MEGVFILIHLLTEAHLDRAPAILFPTQLKSLVNVLALFLLPLLCCLIFKGLINLVCFTKEGRFCSCPVKNPYVKTKNFLGFLGTYKFRF